MATDDSGTGTAGRPRPGASRPGRRRGRPGARSSSAGRPGARGRGPFRPARYEVAYYPEGLTDLAVPGCARPPLPTTVPGRRTPRTCTTCGCWSSRPGPKATTAGRPGRCGTPRWPASVTCARSAGPSDGRWTTTAPASASTARPPGEVPVRVRHPRRGDWVVDGLVHELTAPERTRCGLGGGRPHAAAHGVPPRRSPGLPRVLLARAPHVGPAHVASRRAARLPRSSVAAMKRALVLWPGPAGRRAGAQPGGCRSAVGFYSNDKTYYSSPWFGGRAPDHDPVRLHQRAVLLPRPRCTGHQPRLPPRHRHRDAVRHRLFASRRAGWSNARSGPAYGRHPILIRNPTGSAGTS